jgi:hypothetical protein
MPAAIFHMIAGAPQPVTGLNLSNNQSFGLS